MGPRAKELIGVLDQIIALLENEEERQWVEWLRESKRRLEAFDESGIEHLFWAYEGMGSFNDLMICQSHEDGVYAWKPGAVEKNARLDALRSQAYNLLEFLRDHPDPTELEP